MRIDFARVDLVGVDAPGGVGAQRRLDNVTFMLWSHDLGMHALLSFIL